MTVLVLTEAELRDSAPMDGETLTQVENAFTWLAEGKVAMPPVMHIEVDAQSDVDIKSAYVRGLDAFAVKLASGFFNNPSLGLQSSSGMMVLMSAKTGFCEAVLLDNGYLTDLRTGLAGAVAARHLAPENPGTVGVIGAGAQARYQIESLALVRNFERVLVAGRSRENVDAYVADMTSRLAVEVCAADSIEQVVRESQIVVTTTQSREPLIEAEWLHPGLHITAMGSDFPGKQELDPNILGAVDRLVCDRKTQCVIGGELQHGVSAGLIDEDTDVIELGQVTSGQVPGRTDTQQITLCDLTGTGVQDTAIAVIARDKALARGLGSTIES